MKTMSEANGDKNIFPPALTRSSHYDSASAHFLASFRQHHQNSGHQMSRPYRTDVPQGSPVKSAAFLSDQTLERLLASQQRGLQHTKHRQQKRLTGRDNPVFYTGGSSFGRTTAHGSLDSCRLSSSGNKLHVADSEGWQKTKSQDENEDEGTSKPSMRLVSSLDSLDAVSSSIQQARANSLNRSNCQIVANSNSVHCQTAKSTLMGRLTAGDENGDGKRRETAPLRENSATSATGGAFTAADYHQKTFPMRKSGCRSSDFDLMSFSENGTNFSWPWKSHEELESSGRATNELEKPSPRGGVEFSEKSHVRSSFQDKEEKRSNSNAQIQRSRRDQTRRDSDNSFGRGEMSRLRRELREEQERVQRLTAQLSTNSHVISAFEHSLANLTERLAKLTGEAEKKDEELHDMKKVIKGLKESEENLSKSNGSLSAHDFTSDGTRVANPSYPSRWKSDENVLMLSNDNNISEMRPNATQRKKSSTWLRSSFTRAFRRKSSSQSASSLLDCPTQDVLPGDVVDLEYGRQEAGHFDNNNCSQQRSASISALDESTIFELRRQLEAKEDLLTETRLEALNTASQLQTLRESIARLRTELKGMKRENEDLRGRLEAATERRQQQKCVPHQSYFYQQKKQQTIVDDAKIKSNLVVDFSRGLRDGKVKDVVPVFLTMREADEVSICIGRLQVSSSDASSYIDHVAFSALALAIQRLLSLYLTKLDLEGDLGIDALKLFQTAESISVFGGTIPLKGDQDSNVGNLLQLTSGVADASEVDKAAETIRVNLGMSSAGTALFNLVPTRVLEECVDKMEKERILLLPTSPPYLLADRIQSLCVNIVKISLKKSCQPCTVKVVSKVSVEDIVKTIVEESGEVKGIVLKGLDTQAKAKLWSSQEELIARDVRVLVIESNLDPEMDDFATMFLDRENIVVNHIRLNLRKRLLTAETSSQFSNSNMWVAVEWLSDVIEHFIKDLNFEPHLDKCPLKSTYSFRTWFVDLWNKSLALALRDKIPRPSNTDPLLFIIQSWPWPEDVPGLPRALEPIFGEDKLLSPNLGNPEERTKPEGAEDPLMSMLMSLQQSNLESSTKFESTCETGNVSTSPQASPKK